MKLELISLDQVKIIPENDAEFIILKAWTADPASQVSIQKHEFGPFSKQANPDYYLQIIW